MIFSTVYYSDVDGYGFQRPKDFDHEKYEAFMSAYLRIMARRAIRWKNLVGNKDTVTKSGTSKNWSMITIYIFVSLF